MNKRIRELMWDAGLNSNYVEGFDSIYSEQLEKFAELIVRECAGIAYEYDIPNLSGLGEFIGNRIKKHFGVEE